MKDIPPTPVIILLIFWAKVHLRHAAQGVYTLKIINATWRWFSVTRCKASARSRSSVPCGADSKPRGSKLLHGFHICAARRWFFVVRRKASARLRSSALRGSKLLHGFHICAMRRKSSDLQISFGFTDYACKSLACTKTTLQPIKWTKRRTKLRITRKTEGLRADKAWTKTTYQNTPKHKSLLALEQATRKLKLNLQN